MSKLIIQTLELKDPTWGAASALPGQEIELGATATVAADQWIEFRIRHSSENTPLDSIDGKPGEAKAKWTPSSTPTDIPIKFDALLREKPTVKNGHQTVLAKLESPEITLQGFKAEIVSLDACFVPKQEKLELKYKITDPGAAAKKGCIYVWGERYPKDEHLFFEDFDPAVGEKTWDTWDGKANHGHLSGKYISPEFSPYRIQVIIGPDADSVKEPFGKGAGKVNLVEKQFQIKFETILVRMAANLPSAVTNVLKPDEVLVVEPRTAKGAYAHKSRTPLEKEPEVAAGWAGGGEGASAAKDRLGIGRIRVKNLRHNQISDSLNQGSSASGDPANVAGATKIHRIADAYTTGQTKWTIDGAVYKRPEIPLEFEARLTSREPSVEAKKNGLFEKEAIGPARFDLLVEDPYQKWMHEAGGTPLVTLYDEARKYNKKAAWQVKRGTHDDPFNDSGKAVITYWQERFEIASHGQEEVGDTEVAFVKEKKELTVFLNGVRMERDDDATTDNSKRIKLDYAEISDKKIKFRKGLTRAKDEVWIVRQPHAGLSHPAVTNWVSNTPGDNCPEHYGGIRGKVPTDDMVGTLRKDYSGTLAGQFPYTAQKTINLDPDKMTDLAKRERVVSQASTVDGDQKGLAGVIFSPSYIGGDKYVVEARLKECAYDRDLGSADPRPVSWHTKGRSGVMTVWRMLTLSASWRLPSPLASGGLSAGVGESDPAAAGRAHPASGRKMNFIGLNAAAEKGFNEWIALKSDGSMAMPNEEAHQDVNLGNYRSFFNGKSTAGFYNIASDTNIKNEFVQWDHYRRALPPGIAANRRNVASWYIHNEPKGTDSQSVGNAVAGGIQAYDTTNTTTAADSGLGTAPAVSTFTGTKAEYHAWVKGECKKLANEYMDTIMPQEDPPTAMRVLRWPKLYWSDVWYGVNGASIDAKNLGIGGYCRGNGQAFFFSLEAQDTTFEHEMGHSLLLSHFAAGGVTNFAWKQHDHKYQNCLMGYNSGNFTVPRKAAATGTAITIATSPRNHLCPKCLAKIRGWKEDVLPCNWDHPDVF